MTNEIRALISQRDATARKLERKDLANREEESAKYNRLKSMVKSQFRRGAKEYGSVLLAENNTRDAWKFLRDVSFTTTKSERTSMDINILDDYLAKTVQNSNATELYIADSCDGPDSFTLTELLAEDVLYILSNLPTRTATGPDGRSATLLRQLAPALASNLTKIMNHSLTEGKVPDQWKKANVVAVWKNKGAKNAPENYRPISILPVLARLFEKIVAKQLSRYCYEHNVIPQQQFGFRESSNCEMALLTALNSWMGRVDAGELVVGALLSIYRRPLTRCLINAYWRTLQRLAAEEMRLGGFRAP